MSGIFCTVVLLYTHPPLSFSLLCLFSAALFLAWRLSAVRDGHARGLLQDDLVVARGAAGLYFRGLEALAQAIDAKDQTTPGHVRRTQVYAVELGKLLGLAAGEIETLRAGALLHDVGKLAVPDYILNRPGELTPAEFEKVKIHAAVGADIVRRAGFPPAIESIVRHHHEKWDGTGYPSGLEGEAIPPAAHVIGVVDFYDVSRCDRPHRAGATREEALARLGQKAGTSFDPRIVKLFIDHVAEFDRLISAEDLSEQVPDPAPFGISLVSAKAGVAHPSAAHAGEISGTGFSTIAEAHREGFALHELTRVVGSSLNLSDTLALVTNRLAGVVPFETCVVFVGDEKTGGVAAVHAAGARADFFAGRILAAGEGVTGWVVTNNRPLRDGAPELDLRGAPAEIVAGIRAVLSAPLAREEGAFGAITLYSSDSAYTIEQLRLLETFSLHASGAISSALTFERTKETALTDSLTGLPNGRALRLTLEQRLAECRRLDREPFAVLCFDLDDFRLANEEHGFGVGDQLLAAAAGVIKKQLRAMDTLARLAGDEFVAVLPAATEEAAALAAGRVSAAIEAENFVAGVVRNLRLSFSVGIAVYPAAGETADEVIAAAARDMRRDKRQRKTLQPPAPNSGNVIRLDSFR